MTGAGIVRPRGNAAEVTRRADQQAVALAEHLRQVDADYVPLAIGRPR